MVSTHTHTHTHNGISVMKNMKFCHWQNMDGPKEYCLWNKTEERQILYLALICGIEYFERETDSQI